MDAATASPTKSRKQTHQSLTIKEVKDKKFANNGVTQKVQNQENQMACIELIQFRNKQYQNSSYKDKIMQGYLRKRVDKVKIFQKEMYPKRFFIIDFEDGTLTIQLKENSKISNGDKVTEYQFNEIRDAVVISEES